MNALSRVFLYLLFAAFVAGTTTACNTTRGFGQDVEAAGEGIEDTAEDAEEELED